MALPATPPEAFRIAVRPLAEDPLLVVDADLPRYLAEKARLAAERFGDIFMAEPETTSAQAETLALVAGELVARHPRAFIREGTNMTIAATGETVRFDNEKAPPLWTAARLCQEDLVLMRRSETSWRLAAAALCFPSAWRLAEKFGQTLDAVHTPVPGFGAGSRNAALIARMFDKLRPDTPVLRWNWGLYGDAALYHPHDNAGGPGVHVRLERQTLTKLPESGDILFTIRIFLDALPQLAKREGGRDLLIALRRQIEGFSPEQTAYKGLTADRDRLLALLAEQIGEPA